MSVTAKLKDIDHLVRGPLLDAQNALDDGLRALSGLRYLLANRDDDETEGLAELLRMVEERFIRADAQMKVLHYNTFGALPVVPAR